VFSVRTQRSCKANNLDRSRDSRKVLFPRSTRLLILAVSVGEAVDTNLPSSVRRDPKNGTQQTHDVFSTSIC
jgi:hypothetical protein